MQCKNGHIICALCCEKLKQGCPSCSKPTGRIRNIAIEKILESLEVSCKHAAHGCQEVLKFTKQRDHEEHLCKYRSYLCPIPHCQHKCPKGEMPLHFEQEHRARTVMVGEGVQTRVTMTPSDQYVVLQDGKKLFLVHHECWGSLGNIFFCSSFETSNRICQLGIVWSGEDIKEYSMSSRVYDNQREEGSVLKVKERGNFLVVPHGLHPQAQISEFEVRITILSEDQNALQLVET